MAAPALDRATILETIRTWPVDEQQALALEILQSVAVPVREEPLAPPDAGALAGLFAGAHTPPTDEQIAQWLDEQRREKYGG